MRPPCPPHHIPGKAAGKASKNPTVFVGVKEEILSAPEILTDFRAAH